jgi:hypothetical protein
MNNEREEYSPTSRLEKPEEIQERKIPVFDCAVARSTMQNALLVMSILTGSVGSLKMGGFC